MPVIKKVIELIVKNPQYIVIVYNLLKEIVESGNEVDNRDNIKKKK